MCECAYTTRSRLARQCFWELYTCSYDLNTSMRMLITLVSPWQSSVFDHSLDILFRKKPMKTHVHSKVVMVTLTHPWRCKRVVLSHFRLSSSQDVHIFHCVMLVSLTKCNLSIIGTVHICIPFEDDYLCVCDMAMHLSCRSVHISPFVERVLCAEMSLNVTPTTSLFPGAVDCLIGALAGCLPPALTHWLLAVHTS